MSEVLKPLIMYKLNEETGEISKLHIHSYEHGKYVGNKEYYRFRFNSQRWYCYSNDVDKVKDWRMYTFHENDDYAKQKFLEYVEEKYSKYNREALRYSAVLKKLKE